MPISAKQVAMVHVAKRQLALSDEEYHDIIDRIGRVTSAKDLDSYGLDRVLDYFGQLGFKNTSKRKPFGRNRPGMASYQQCGLIRALWSEFTDGEGTDETLGKWLDRTFHVSALRFLPGDDARKVIGALQAMKRRKVEQQDQPAAAS